MISRAHFVSSIFFYVGYGFLSAVDVDVHSSLFLIAYQSVMSSRVFCFKMNGQQALAGLLILCAPPALIQIGVRLRAIIGLW